MEPKDNIEPEINNSIASDGVKAKLKKLITKKRLLIVLPGLALTVAAFAVLFTGSGPLSISKIDDWQFNPKTNENYVGLTGGSTGIESALSSGASSDSIGFSVGGSKDINALREDIENNYLPLPTDITYEGLFYDYLFDTGQQEECDKLFCPSFSTAISKDPFSKKDEYFMAVGLNSNIKQEDFSRKKLNLIVVMDISGSMSSPFGQYYYDQYGNRVENQSEESDKDKTKMQIANESAVALLDHLGDDDRFSMVLFDDEAYLAKPFRAVKTTDMQAIKNHILEIKPQGGTNMSAGMQLAMEQFDDVEPSTDYENRVIFLTDAQPNQGDLTESGMTGIARTGADKGVYSTFIGVGLDFNTELIEQVTKIRGANYYSVKTPSEFKQRMDDGFEYMVTPLVFDLELRLEAGGFEILEVYGSPEASEATGEILKVNTLFPSERKEGETRGGLILVHMRRKSNDNHIKIATSYKDRIGTQDGSKSEFDFETKPEYFDNNGIHKGILLSRYANLLKNWLVSERGLAEQNPLPSAIAENVDSDQYIHEGIPIVDVDSIARTWEQQSIKLEVSTGYKQLFRDFLVYFKQEAESIGDQELGQETSLMNKLIK